MSLSLLKSLFLAEQDRWILWTPVLLGLGVLLYFGLAVEPSSYSGIAAFLLFLVALVRGQHPVFRLIALAGLLMAFGFMVAQLRTFSVNAPVIEKSSRSRFVTGTVQDLDYLTGNGTRVVLSDLRIKGLDTAVLPEKVRIRLTRYSPVPKAGDRIEVLAMLNPPPPPVLPGGFYFARQMYFQKIGAVGYAVGRAKILLESKETSFALFFEKLRGKVKNRIGAVLDEKQAAVATALLTGERRAIPEETLQNIRTAGLAHLLAISGLHIGLVAGLIFFAVRFGLALHEKWALSYPIKKWAALAALPAALFYTLMVGAPVTTQRAMFMTGLMLCAVLVDRTSISLRLVAFAAFFVLLFQPDSLLGASFQMSFGAVIALVAFYEYLRPHWMKLYTSAGFLRRFLLYFVGTLLTSLVAGLATAPMTIFHFQHMPFYGFIGNLLAMPLMAMWIMPWGIVTYLLMPFGLESLALVPLGLGIDLLLKNAEWVASFPPLFENLPALPPHVFILSVIGGLWLCLWRRKWRLVGLLPMVLSLLILPFQQDGRPDILVAEEADLVAVRREDGALAFSSRRTARFTAGVWKRHNGQGEFFRWPKRGEEGLLSCDNFACLYRHKGKTISIVNDRRALKEDCDRVDMVISLVPAKYACKNVQLIDFFDFRENGTHAIYLDKKEIRIKTVRETLNQRPWSY